MDPFKNEPFSNFSDPTERHAFEAALEVVEKNLGETYPLLIGSEKIFKNKDQTFSSHNPAAPTQTVGIFQKASRPCVDKAIAIATEAFQTWSKVSPKARAEILFKAATRMRERKHIFSAWMVFEVGKTWAEADGDTAEAIDFMEFYAREMLRLSAEQPLTRIALEKNELRYIPLGVGAVIPPWNFPLAICVGMTSAAIVCGNTVVLKPASDSPTIAWKFVDLLEEVGLPKGVVNFLTGDGAEIGDHLIEHADIRFISFTGSKEVGLRITEKANTRASNKKWIKRIVAEMGGKDAIVVDENTDAELVAKGIVQSAFGFGGQKCSACSRALIHEKMYESVKDKILMFTQKLMVLDPKNPKADLGPVVSERAFKKILETIDFGKTEGSLLTGGRPIGNTGFFIEPTVFEGIEKHHRLFQEEIFGPVLSLTKIKSFDEGLELANATEFGLTGAVYSNNREHLEKAKEQFFVGNLYLNRKCTGALVGVHPFGGFNMSGTDSKAGGRDYLLLFTQAKLISEKL